VNPDDDGQQRGRSASVSGICELFRHQQVGFRRPSIDEDVHDPAAGADFLLIEIPGQVDLGKARLGAVFK